jgi:hypothetical protein
MEGALAMKMKTRSALFVFLLSILSGCQSSFLQVEKEDDIKLKSDIDKTVIVEEEKVEAEQQKGKSKPPPLLAPEKPAKANSASKKPSKAASKKGSASDVSKKDPNGSSKKESETSVETSQPSIEDQEGFSGRRPIKDPFHVGEKITHEAYYNLFGFTAGVLTLDTLPHVQVNGRKAYQFVIRLQTSKLFNSIYSIDDKVVTLVDYDLWLPRLFTLHVKETSQLREGRSYFDFQKLKARYEEKKISKKKGLEEKKQEWDILPYSQNVFSVIYYMRLFAWRDGRDYSFRVADENENLIFKGRVVARETLDTDIGPVRAIKIKPEIILKGNFKPVGDIFIWLSDDDRKIPLRIESKIKIGTIVSEITDYQPGRAP